MWKLNKYGALNRETGEEHYYKTFGDICYVWRDHKKIHTCLNGEEAMDFIKKEIDKLNGGNDDA